MAGQTHRALIERIVVTQDPEDGQWYDVGTIGLEPPLEHIGPEFIAAVIGRNAVGVRLGEVLSDRDHMTFLVRVALFGGDGRHKDIVQQVAERIERLANAPSDAAEMIFEQPFQAH